MRTAILAAALAAALACTAEHSRPMPAPDSTALAEATSLAPVATTASGALMRQRAVSVSDATTLFPAASVATSMVIRTGQAAIEVDSLERAVAQVRLLAGRVGGYVAN